MWKLPEPPGALKRAWPHVRAVLIFLHVAAIFVMCLPAPYKMANKRSWKTAQARAEVAGWAKRLSSVGVNMTPEEFEEQMYGITLSYLKLRTRVNKPFRRYHRISELRQGWAMFTYPQTHPGWLHVDLLKPGGKYQPIYIQHSDEHEWRRTQFDNNRLRKLLGRVARRHHGHPAYIALSNWIARQAAKDFPDASHVRVRHFRQRTLKPGRGKPPPGKFVGQRIYPLDRYR